jgi:hypothetical protein
VRITSLGRLARPAVWQAGSNSLNYLLVVAAAGGALEGLAVSVDSSFVQPANTRQATVNKQKSIFIGPLFKFDPSPVGPASSAPTDSAVSTGASIGWSHVEPIVLLFSTIAANHRRQVRELTHGVNSTDPGGVAKH